MKKAAKEGWGVNTKEFIKDENGNLKAVKVVDVEWEIDATSL